MKPIKPLASLKQKITLAFYLIFSMTLVVSGGAVLLSKSLENEVDHIVRTDTVLMTTALLLAKDSQKLQFITAKLERVSDENERIALLNELSAQWDIMLSTSRQLAALESAMHKLNIDHYIDRQLTLSQQVPLLNTLTDSALLAQNQASNIQTNVGQLQSAFALELQGMLKDIAQQNEQFLDKHQLEKLSTSLKTHQHLAQFLHLGERLFSALKAASFATTLPTINQAQRKAMRLLLDMEQVASSQDLSDERLQNWLSQIRPNMVGDDNLFDVNRVALKSQTISSRYLKNQALTAEEISKFAQGLVTRFSEEITTSGSQLKSDSNSFMLLVLFLSLVYCVFIWLTNWHFITKGIIRPVIATSEAMQAIANEALDTPLPKAENLELQQMVNSLETLKSYAAQVKAMAEIDGLTGAFNRRYFDHYLEKSIGFALRTQTPLSLILFDIDSFKLFNDRYGHVEGDLCLKAIVQATQEVLQQPSSVLARYGGEEFAILMQSTPIDRAYQLAELVRLKVQALGVVHADSEHGHVVTISVGVTSLKQSQTETAEALIHSADAALYHAKQLGRNRTEYADALSVRGSVI